MPALTMADIFSDASFGIAEMSGQMERFPATQGKMAKLGLFAVGPGLSTKSAIIDIKDGELQLVQSVPWGSGPRVLKAKDTRKAKSFLVPHYYNEDEVLAADVMGVRAFGTANELETVASRVADKLAAHRRFYDISLEFAMIKAVQGKVIDGDGSTILDLNSDFGQARPSLDFALLTDATDVKAKCLETVRYLEQQAGNQPLNGIRAMCSDGFFDAFTAHPQVVEAWKYYPATVDRLQNQQDKVGFTFGGITWENYTGSFGGVAYVEANTAAIFPIAPAYYSLQYACADWEETVNTPGQPYYAKQASMSDGRGRHLWTQSNPLLLMKRPGMLLRAQRDSAQNP